MKYFSKLFLGIITGGILALVACSSLSSIPTTATVIENYYDKIGVDFIIPSPWYTQIKELREMRFIDTVTPYYVHKKKISSPTTTMEINLFSFEIGDNLLNSAFSENILIKGSKLNKDGILLDERTATILDVDINEKVTIGFGSKKITYTVTGIIEDNRFSTRPSACIYINEIVIDYYKSENPNLAYAHAYIKANNLSETENFLLTEYRAMGKVGNRTWYDSDSEYFFMKESIEKESVWREVIDVNKLRAKENFQVEEKKKSDINAIIVSLCILHVGFPLVWIFIIVIMSSSIHKRIRNNTSLKKIIKEYYFGEIVSFIVFDSLLFLLLGKEVSLKYLISTGIAFLSILLTIGFSKRILSKKAKK